MTKSTILAVIDTLGTYNDKLEYLNECFIQAENASQQRMILDMIEQLKQWGK